MKRFSIYISRYRSSNFSGYFKNHFKWSSAPTIFCGLLKSFPTLITSTIRVFRFYLQIVSVFAPTIQIEGFIGVLTLVAINFNITANTLKSRYRQIKMSKPQNKWNLWQLLFCHFIPSALLVRHCNPIMWQIHDSTNTQKSCRNPIVLFINVLPNGFHFVWVFCAFSASLSDLQINRQGIHSIRDSKT